MRGSAFIRNLVVLASVLLSAVGGVYGQTGTSSVRGVITDKTGASVADAKVTLDLPGQALHRETMSSSSGEYSFLALQPATYIIHIEKAGFRSFEQKNLQLLVNAPATLDVTLEVGASNQTVEVSAQSVALNTTDASLGNAFNESQVKELPLEGRNVPDLLSLQPGVAYPNNRQDVPMFDTRKGAVNGARSDQSNVTVDGISANDQGGNAFTAVLPVTLDSVQEFRVSTSNYNADQGSSSGAQVALVTKSGTNNFHGSAYEYNRNTATSANDYFVKGAQEDAGEPNRAPKLIRNIFGASVGGPIKKDRLFLFLNYEGTRRIEEQSVTDVVPSDSLKDGVIFYACSAPAQCPGGTVNGLTGTYNVPAGYNGLSPTQVTAIDPLHIGPSAPVLQYLNTWPTANSAACGDGFNYQCFNFSGPISDTKNEYISHLDYNITRDARHRLSVTAALRNDNLAGAPFLPGQVPSLSTVNYNKGIIVSYTAVFSPTLLNTFRYGYIRESVGQIGNSNQDWIFFRGLNDQTGAVTRTNSYQRPVNNFADDFTKVRGNHTLQFGTQMAFIRNPSNSFVSSFSDGSANASWVDTSGYAGKSGSPLNPANNGLPGVDGDFANSYDYPLQALLGMVTEVDAQYNFQRDGSALPEGAALKRRFALDSYEFYMQDVWKIKPTLTVTAGLRYSLFSPPWETNKLEVAPTFSLGDWFANRAAEGQNGIPSNQDPSVAFNWAGKANGTSGFYNWDYHNFAPRLALAWAPRGHQGLLGSLFGDGKTSVRAGFGIVYDRFGEGLVQDFNSSGSFGLSTQLTNPAGFQTVESAPRLTDIHTIPTTDNDGNQIFAPAPAANFPQPFPTGSFFIGSSIDSGLKTPYSYTLDLSISRELKSGFSFEVAYVGRLSHRLLTQEDVATPLDLKDKSSGLDYFTAITALAKLYRSGVTSGTFNNSMVSPAVAQYWTNMIQPLHAGDAYQLGSSGGCGGGPGSTTNPVLAAFDIFCGSSLNETTGLLDLDYFGIPSSLNPDTQAYFPSGGQYSFYNPQYATLYAWRSIGTANYNALQASLKHQWSHGFQFDFNYTYSKSIDLASDAERVGTIGGIGSQIINAWDPFQFRAPSDFDATHQFNANWIADLPFGRGKTFAHDSGKGLDALIGGWQLSGLFRWTSGFPFSVFNGQQWPTDWDLSGNAYLTGKVKTGNFADPTDPTIVSAFSTLSDAQTQFTEPFPGQAGTRNNLRGDGFFSIDMGLSKAWTMPWNEAHKLKFRWEVFNITNSVRFDTQSINAIVDFYGGSFGNYTRLSTNPRVMQFALRYEF